mmetsp:Transcript_3958/g.6035  ORF Transcript_3958/g.6035 Transcript_3958/m.6035 type:complete len:254 (+) Transcript_3958:83-844(+)
MSVEKEHASDTLFLVGVPEDCQIDKIERVFRTCDGFVSCRIRKDRSNSTVAFAQFVDETSASKAKERHGHFDLDGCAVEAFFARSNSRKRSREDSVKVPLYSSGRTPLSPMTRRQLKTVVSPMNSMVVSERFGMMEIESQIMHPMGLLPMHLPSYASCTLYIEGIPLDATEREIAHIYRPFPGFLSLRIRNKESKGGGLRAMGFVEFDDPYNATIAKIATQNYMIDLQSDSDETLLVHYSSSKKKNHNLSNEK